MPLCPGSGQGNRIFPVVVDAGYFLSRRHRNLLQLPRSRHGTLGVGCRSLHHERPGMATHLLDVDAPRDPLSDWEPLRGGIAALAIPARTPGTSTQFPAALPVSGPSSDRTEGNGAD